jgi:hypothetical protein
MTQNVDVRSVEALSDFASALKRYGHEAEASLAAFAREVEQTMRWIESRIDHWQREEANAHAAATRARAALAACQASGYRDKHGRYHAPDCSAQERHLRACMAQLRVCQKELANARQWKQRVEKAGAKYELQAQRLKRILSTELPRAASSLNQKAATLIDYAVGHSLAQAMLADSTHNTFPKTEPITWSQQQSLLEKVMEGQAVTQEELDQLMTPASDLSAGTLQPDRIVDNTKFEQWHELRRELELIHLPVNSTWCQVIKAVTQAAMLIRKIRQNW